MTINISVIIPTRNRAKLLDRALESLRYQTYPKNNFEILVIDNDSIDGTKTVCNKFLPEFPNLIYHHNPILGLHAGRHFGLKKAKGEIIVFTDDDIRAFPTWLEAIAETFQDPEVTLVGGKILPDYESSPPEWISRLWKYSQQGRWLGYYSVLDFGDEIHEISPLFVWGCNYAIRKEVVFELGGFHPDGMPKELIRYRGDGETSLSIKLLKSQYKTIYNPSASVHHFVSSSRMNKDYLKWRSYIQGISDSYTHIRRSQGIKFRDELFGRLNLLINRLRWLNKPFGKIIMDSWWAGYCYHRNEAKMNQQLLAWVLKDNYI
jgi:glycosyltransferase involved in cell wall biosynthesis